MKCDTYSAAVCESLEKLSFRDNDDSPTAATVDDCSTGAIGMPDMASARPIQELLIKIRMLILEGKFGNEEGKGGVRFYYGAEATTDTYYGRHSHKEAATTLR